MTTRLPKVSITYENMRTLDQQAKDRIQLLLTSPKFVRHVSDVIYHREGQRADPISFKISASTLDSSGRMQYIITCGGGWKCLRYMISPYPACCGMWQLNDFYVNEKLFTKPYQSILNNLLTTLVESHLKYTAEPRIVLNLVHVPPYQRKRQVRESLLLQEASFINRQKDLRAYIKGGHKEYAPMHGWAKSLRKESSVLLFNRNSYNVIEHKIVNFK